MAITHGMRKARLPFPALLEGSGGASGEEPVCQRRRRGLDPWVGKIPGEGNGYPLLYSCLENPMDRGAWRATVHRVPKSRTRLK